MNRTTSTKRKFRIGYFVFGGLVLLKVAEYLVSHYVRLGNWPYMLVLAVAGAWLILYYYKHIYQLWRREEEDHE